MRYIILGYILILFIVGMFIVNTGKNIIKEVNNNYYERIECIRG